MPNTHERLPDDVSVHVPGNGNIFIIDAKRAIDKAKHGKANCIDCTV